jgi:putative phosphoesterase
MKLFIASDIHGSAYFADLTVKKFAESGADKLVLLGDILYHGPRNDLPRDYAPKAVIAMLNPLSDKILAVRGNCEAEVDSMVLDFNVASDYMTLYDGKVTICASHGHRDIPRLGKGDVLLCGHTHVPKIEEREGGYIYMNPGSTSIPKEASPHSYVIYEDGVFTWFDLETGESYMSSEEIYKA